MLNEFFQLHERKTSIRIEVVAGLTTFLTMAYIIFVNPLILSAAGMDKNALIVVTCLATAIATLIVGVFAKAPIAMAPGMGLNAFFAYLVVSEKMDWQTALGVVFLSGLLFFVLTILGLRKRIVEAIPVSLISAIAVGIGLFITFIGLTKLGIVVGDEHTLVKAGPLKPAILVGLFGLLVMLFFEMKKISGGLVVGILTSTVLAALLGYIKRPDHLIRLVSPHLLGSLILGPIYAFKVKTLYAVLLTIEVALLTVSLIVITRKAIKKGTNLKLLICFILWTVLFLGFLYKEKPLQLLQPYFTLSFHLDVIGALKWGFLGSIFTLMFMDMFDSVGTLVACCHQANMVDEKGRIKGLDRLLGIDAIATMLGALLGTSTTTSYVESAAGIEQGGRTGLTSVVTGICFLLALLFVPIVRIVPEYATAPALIMVGLFMMKEVKRIDFMNLEEAFPAFIIMVMIALSYSISTGLAFGFISFTLMKLISGKVKEIKPAMWVIAILSLLFLTLDRLGDAVQYIRSVV